MDIPTQYCELSFLGLQQPLNVLTSLFFIFFAFLAYKKTNKLFLPFLLGLIGVGSVLWHSTSSPLGDLLDTLSIAVFSLIITFIIFYKVFTNKLVAILSLLLFIAIAFFVEQLPELNGSLVYILMFFALLIISLKSANISPVSKRSINIALITFGIAIIFRIIDPLLCEYISIGSHFIWHTLMAYFGYNLIIGLEKNNEIYIQN